MSHNPDRIWVTEAEAAAKAFQCEGVELLEYVRKDSDSIEAALAELREMCPNATFLYVKQEANFNKRRGRHAISREPMIAEDSTTSVVIQVDGSSFPGDSIDEAMAQVRAWKGATEVSEVRCPNCDHVNDYDPDNEVVLCEECDELIFVEDTDA